MNLVRDQEEVMALVQAVKQKSGSLLTNFFADAEKTASWIADRRLFYQQDEEGVLFFRKDYWFYHLYFYAKTPDSLLQSLAGLPDQPYTADIIGKSRGLTDMTNIFVKAGFVLRRQLYRYTRINKSDCNVSESSDDVEVAKKNDADQISQMFYDHFDKLSEQVPEPADVKALIEAGKIILVKSGGIIKGFLVRSFTGQTTLLNNFLVRPEYRGEKIGSKLLKHYIFEAKFTKRMVLWVVSDNATAIGVYEKYGYVKDDLMDCILTKNHEQNH